MNTGVMMRMGFVGIGMVLTGAEIVYLIGRGFDSPIYWCITLPVCMILGYAFGRVAAPWVWGH